MAFQNSGQTGSQPVASTQLAQEYIVDTSVADYEDLIPVILTRGAPRVLVLAEQTVGAVAGALQIEVAVSNRSPTIGNPSRLAFRRLGSPTLTPFDVPIAIERAVPTKYIRVVPTPQGANDITVRIVVMAAQ